ncbi:MAG TPA: hypothetical protein VFK45_00535 [Gammaproteobacteria bacterium]|nr:hypothetical protein [Gammaproteobacteria bacterium]
MGTSNSAKTLVFMAEPQRGKAAERPLSIVDFFAAVWAAGTRHFPGFRAKRQDNVPTD